eukprot:CAMPEP_0197472812 /NCGR_PEP_ID=MMETSP1309-20131121/4096_1 /TAXON_ID=464262 /ORGANISM="Genus nov. species nov., Strain RCC998" /LENGTH=96 /DNA_ID=CAMNT_0043011605 /DNA_START=217 /DNA_END=507 /DNA_ORIENTATION=-
MMFPGITYSPPNFLTPRNFGFESLPFFEVPPDFFVAVRVKVCIAPWRLLAESAAERDSKLLRRFKEDAAAAAAAAAGVLWVSALVALESKRIAGND